MKRAWQDLYISGLGVLSVPQTPFSQPPLGALRLSAYRLKDDEKSAVLAGPYEKLISPLDLGAKQYNPPTRDPRCRVPVRYRIRLEK